LRNRSGTGQAGMRHRRPQRISGHQLHPARSVAQQALTMQLPLWLLRIGLHEAGGEHVQLPGPRLDSGYENGSSRCDAQRQCRLLSAAAQMVEAWHLFRDVDRRLLRAGRGLDPPVQRSRDGGAHGEQPGRHCGSGGISHDRRQRLRTGHSEPGRPRLQERQPDRGEDQAPEGHRLREHPRGSAQPHGQEQFTDRKQLWKLIQGRPHRAVTRNRSSKLSRHLKAEGSSL